MPQTPKNAKKRLKTLVGLSPHIRLVGEPSKQKNSNGEDETASNASSQASTASSTMSGFKRSDSIASLDPRDAAAEILRAQSGDLKLNKLIQKLNDRLLKAQKHEDDPDDSIHKVKKLEPQVVQWLIRLCHGDIMWNGWHHLAYFVREARRREREKKVSEIVSNLF